MKLLVIILNKTDVLDYLLEGLSAAGIKGATIIESSGMAMTLSRLDSSFLSASIRGLFSGEEDNRTILSVIKNNQLDTARKIVYNTVGPWIKKKQNLRISLRRMKRTSVDEMFTDY